MKGNFVDTQTEMLVSTAEASSDLNVPTKLIVVTVAATALAVAGAYVFKRVRNHRKQDEDLGAMLDDIRARNTPKKTTPAEKA